MANSNTNVSGIKFATVDSSVTPKALNSNSVVDSDVQAIHADAGQGKVIVSCDNQGTPASGDYIDVWIKYSPNASLFPSNLHAQLLGRIDTFLEDPAVQAFDLNVEGGQQFKLTFKANQGASRTVNVVAIYNEWRGA